MTSLLKRIEIAHLPTPIEPLSRLSQVLDGPDIWVKRDDETGLAFGGNKTRKLEYLLAEAEEAGARTLITRGARQSNHCRQTAAAAARAGFDCTLVLGGEPPQSRQANVLLDFLLGAEIVFARDADPEQVLLETVARLREEGRDPYLIPYGGSNPVGASAYVEAVNEMVDQGFEPDRIVFATSSGGTQAGLLAGVKMAGLSTAVYGISVDKSSADLLPTVSKLTNQILALYASEILIEDEEVLIDDGYTGEGYAVMGEPEREAIHLFARYEGLMLDPVYTGRAAAGLIDLIREGHINEDEQILFWHTGGTPALFAYADEL
ncbi:MAG: D-cysteine desulfhydrase family protein [Anaerolineales bacterium]|jgi:D-cysteine desulfhydrase family pyridoxal phosphate-dependent enzyme